MCGRDAHTRPHIASQVLSVWHFIAGGHEKCGRDAHTPVAAHEDSFVKKDYSVRCSHSSHYRSIFRNFLGLCKNNKKMKAGTEQG